ncbi:hypothetical protein NQZ68_002674 [Dissostichus eleginoides]|nr:hypothetical protein NQZ68_002674 [Dissostichus eleginoides]
MLQVAQHFSKKCYQRKHLVFKLYQKKRKLFQREAAIFHHGDVPEHKEVSECSLKSQTQLSTTDAGETRFKEPF